MPPNAAASVSWSLPPFYFKEVAEAGLFDSYARLIERSGDAVRVYLYHFPGMSAVPIGLGLIERLLTAYPGQIIGLKDSSGDFENTKGHHKTLSDAIGLHR